VQVQQRSNVNQAHFINMFQIKSRMKSNAMRREHHKLEKALRNHTESISNCDIIKESDEREKK